MVYYNAGPEKMGDIHAQITDEESVRWEQERIRLCGMIGERNQRIERLGALCDEVLTDLAEFVTDGTKYGIRPKEMAAYRQRLAGLSIAR